MAHESVSSTSTRFNVEERWPEMFAQLDTAQRRSVLNTLAADWHEGWKPNREDVVNLIDLVNGAIDHDEFLRRSDAAAERLRGRALKPRRGEVAEHHGGNPAESVAAATEHMRAAAALAEQLGEHLAEAQNAIAGQGYRTAGE